MRTQFLKIGLCISMVGLFVLFTQAQSERLKSTLFDTLYGMDILNVQVLVDIDSILANKMTKREQAAIMKVYDINGETLELPLDIQVRSKSRRRYCDFPPLKFDFKKGTLKDWGLDNQDDFKIVTHCLDNSKGVPTMLKEYLVYQLYQIITPLSFRTILFDIQYQDIGGGQGLQTKAIILESEEGFAEKQGGTLCDCMGTKPDSIDPFQFELLAMFQYMIGNNDMNYQVERNIKLVRCPGRAGMIPVAYDFDFSAFVNAPYVHPEIYDNKVIARSYLGFEQNASYLDAVKSRFIDKKEDILQAITDFTLIHKRERKGCLRYIKTFYHQIENPRFVMPYAPPE